MFAPPVLSFYQPGGAIRRAGAMLYVQFGYDKPNGGEKESLHKSLQLVG